MLLSVWICPFFDTGSFLSFTDPHSLLEYQGVFSADCISSSPLPAAKRLWFFWFLFCFIPIFFQNCSPYWSLPHWAPSLQSLSSLREWDASLCHFTLVQQVSARLGTSSPSEATQHSHEDWASCLLHMCQDLIPAHVCSFLGDSVLQSSQGFSFLGLLNFLCSSHLLLGHLSFLQLFPRCPCPLFNVCLWVSASVFGHSWI